MSCLQRDMRRMPGSFAHNVGQTMRALFSLEFARADCVCVCALPWAARRGTVQGMESTRERVACIVGAIVALLALVLLWLDDRTKGNR